MDMHLNVLGMQLVYISNKYKLASMALCTNYSTYSVDSAVDEYAIEPE